MVRPKSLPALLAALCLLAPALARGQTVLGVRGGVTVASASIGNLSATFDEGNRTGYAGGLFLTLGSGILAVQPELNFHTKGFELDAPAGVTEVELGYLEPAVLLKAVLPLGNLKPSVFGGLGVGFETACKVDDDDCTALSIETESTDLTAIFGADLSIFLTDRVLLRGDARYAMGARDIRKAGDAFSELKNRAWQLQAGLGFTF